MFVFVVGDLVSRLVVVISFVISKGDNGFNFLIAQGLDIVPDGFWACGVGLQHVEGTSALNGSIGSSLTSSFVSDPWSVVDE